MIIEMKNTCPFCVEHNNPCPTAQSILKWWTDFNAYRDEREPFLSYQWDSVRIAIYYLLDNCVEVNNKNLYEAFRDSFDYMFKYSRNISANTFPPEIMYHRKMMCSLVAHLNYEGKYSGDVNYPVIEDYIKTEDYKKCHVACSRKANA